MATNPEKRKKIRALEAKRDSLSEKKKANTEALKVVRAQLKHARSVK